jgi:hypothetical protein
MLVYLASPYTHPDPAVMQRRFEEICAVAARFIKRGEHIFSPIAHTHPIALAGELPANFWYWEQYAKEMLSVCGELWVYEMDGWRESKGIALEIKIAEELGLRITYCSQYRTPPSYQDVRGILSNEEAPQCKA